MSANSRRQATISRHKRIRKGMSGTPERPRLSIYRSNNHIVAQVIDDCVVENWPGKQSGDLAVVYVALTGKSFSEAVTLTLAQYSEAILIRELAWGRP